MERNRTQVSGNQQPLIDQISEGIIATHQESRRIYQINPNPSFTIIMREQYLRVQRQRQHAILPFMIYIFLDACNLTNN